MQRVRRPARLDRERRGLQALGEDLPAEQRAVVVDLVDPAAEQVGVELLELEHFVQVLRGGRRQDAGRGHAASLTNVPPVLCRLSPVQWPRLALLRYSLCAIFATLRPSNRTESRAASRRMHVQPTGQSVQRVLLAVHLRRRTPQPGSAARAGAGKPAQADRPISTRASPRTPDCASGSWARCASSKPSRKTCAPRPRRTCAPATSPRPANMRCACRRSTRSSTENRKQLEQAEATYKNLVKARDVAVQTARAKIEGLKGAINDMRMNQAMAEIHEMSSGMITSIGGAGDTLNRLRDGRRGARQGRRPRARRQGLRRHERRRSARKPSSPRSPTRRWRTSPRAKASRSRAPKRRRPRRARMGASGNAGRPGQQVAEMPAPQGAPAWAAELALRLRERRVRPVHPVRQRARPRRRRRPPGQSRAATCEDELLAGFNVVLTYDLGNGLTIERGGELRREMGRRGPASALPREPLAAIHCISRYLRYLGNLRALGRERQDATSR